MLWYSLEVPRRGASNEYPQHMFLWKNKKNYPRIITKYSFVNNASGIVCCGLFALPLGVIKRLYILYCDSYWASSKLFLMHVCPNI